MNWIVKQSITWTFSILSLFQQFQTRNHFILELYVPSTKNKRNDFSWVTFAFRDKRQKNLGIITANKPVKLFVVFGSIIRIFE